MTHKYGSDNVTQEPQGQATPRQRREGSLPRPRVVQRGITAGNWQVQPRPIPWEQAKSFMRNLVDVLAAVIGVKNYHAGKRDTIEAIQKVAPGRDNGNVPKGVSKTQATLSI